MLPFPYGGITRIRSEGIISATATPQHPFSYHSDSRCKGTNKRVQNKRKDQEIELFMDLVERKYLL